MRFAKMAFAVGLGLFAAAGFGLAGTWGLVVGTVVMGLGSLVAVVVMEDRDYIGVEGLYPVASDSLQDAAVVQPDEGALAQAA